MIKFKYWSAIATSALLAACSSDDFGGATGEGRIQLQLTVDTQPIGTSSSSRAALEELTLDDMKVRLTHANGTVHNYGSVAEFENEEKFDIGDYNLDVYYGNEKDCGFEKPYVYGTAALTVHHGETTQVDVEAKLANSMVTVTYSDNVSKFFSNFGVTLTSDNGNPVEYPVDTRPVYVTPGNISMRLDYTIGAGDTNNVPVTDFKAEPQHHYRINVDINGGKVGDAVLTISFDDTMEQHELNIALEDLTAPDVPALSATGFDQDTPLPVVAGIAPEGDLYCGIIARGGLKSLVLTTEGSDKIGTSWIPEIDLVSASDNQQDALKKCGLSVRGLCGNGSGETADLIVVDFSKVVATLPDATEGDIKFTLKATDKFGQTAEQDLSLQLSVAALKMELSDIPTEVWEGEDAFTMTLTYNGGDPTQKLQVMYHDALGNPESVPATFTAAGDNTYTVSVSPSQPWGHDFDIYVSETQGTRHNDPTTVEYVKMPTLAVSDVNVWATKAYVTIQDNIDGSYYTPATLKYSTNGTDFNGEMKSAGDKKMMVLEGLTPSTSYTITAVNPNYPDNAARNLKTTITFTTEAATQLPDAGFDTWASVEKGDCQYLWTIGNGATWNSLNTLTTSTSGSGHGNAFSLGGCSYRATSGTIPANGRSTQSSASGGAIGTSTHRDGHTVGNASLHSDKQHSGSNAALIRTVGWGSGNSAHTGTSSNAGFGTCNNTTPGELYLGTYNDAPNYGYNFSSRPSALAFYYHYDVVTSGNGDYGTAEISVYDNAGKVIATASKNLTEQSAYTKAELVLNYTDKNQKAAKISIIFKSSANAAALEHNTTFWHTPGGNNTSGGEYVGSELYIDDIELIY